MGTAAANDTAYWHECCNKIIATRERLIKELDALGFDTLPSCSNFIFTSNKNTDAKTLFEYLRSRGIVVRYFDKPRINDRLRITVGTDEETDKLIEEIKNFLGKN